MIISKENTPKNLFDIELRTLQGSVFDWNTCKGKKILIVNTASECGFTKQYKDLQNLYERYHETLEIIGVPCNQFGKQEPGGAKDIESFCEINFGVTFPLTEKMEVKGEHQHPLYRWLTDKKFNVKPGGTINWEQDPLAAILDMEAVYNLSANPAPLLDNQFYSRGISTDVVIKLTGELESPDIGFNIEFPGSNSIIQSELEYRLQDPTVEERNAIFLLAQGSFVSDQSGITEQAITGNIAQSVSSYLNQLLSSNDDKFKLGINYEQSQQLSTEADI